MGKETMETVNRAVKKEPAKGHYHLTESAKYKFNIGDRVQMYRKFLMVYNKPDPYTGTVTGFSRKYKAYVYIRPDGKKTPQMWYSGYWDVVPVCKDTESLSSFGNDSSHMWDYFPETHTQKFMRHLRAVGSSVCNAATETWDRITSRLR